MKPTSVRHRLCAALGLAAALFQGAAYAQTFQMRLAYPGLTATPAQDGTVTPPVVTPVGAVGALQAVSGADFGVVPLGGLATRQFNFSNTGDSPATGVYVDFSQVAGLALASNTCGAPGSPVSVAAQQSCSFSLQFGGSNGATLAGSSVIVGGAFSGSPAGMALSGSVGAFDVTSYFAAGTTSTSPLVTPVNMSVPMGASASTTFTIRNSGTSGALVVGAVLTGDTDNFTFTVSRITDGNGVIFPCVAGGVVASGSLSVSPCWATDVTGPRPHVRLTVRYTPKSAGPHHVTLTPTTANGSGLPTPLAITGTVI